MANVLVCVKRVPDTAGEVLLSADGLSVDARHVGYGQPARVRGRARHPGRRGDRWPGDRAQRGLGGRRRATAQRPGRGLCGRGARRGRRGPARPGRRGRRDRRVVREREAGGLSYDLVLLGNDAADTGDFQVPVRLAYALGRPVLTGISTCEVQGDRLLARGRSGRDGGLRAAAAGRRRGDGGWRQPALPLDPGADEGQAGARRDRRPDRGAPGVGPGPPQAAAEPAGSVEILGEGPEAAPAVVDLLTRIGVVGR